MASGLTFTKFFFDRLLVIRGMDAATREALYKGGNTIKVTAQRSMRYRKKPSAPGTPPSSHPIGKGKDRRAGLIRRFLFNAFDPTARTQIIGPQGLGRSIVPRLQEEGGTASVRVLLPRPKGKPLSPAAKAVFLRKIKAGQIENNTRRDRVFRVAHFPARPYMKPALDKFLPRLPKLYQSRLRKVG